MEKTCQWRSFVNIESHWNSNSRSKLIPIWGLSGAGPATSQDGPVSINRVLRWTSISSRGSSTTASQFMLGTLWWTSIPSKGSSNAPSRFMLGTLWWTSIPSRGSSNVPSRFMLGTLWWTSIPSKGSSNAPCRFMLGALWWTSILSRGSNNAPSCFMLQKLELSAGTDDPAGSGVQFVGLDRKLTVSCPLVC